jgi:hypothetical protein
MKSIDEDESDSAEIFPRHSSLKKNVIRQDKSQFDILRPTNAGELPKEYKKEDLIKLHEFKRENIQEQFKEIDTDYFKFTDENDPKYNFLNVQNFFRSKLLLKSIKWSFGIGLAFFAHRYYRKQLFWPALRWGGLSWSISMILVWASFELQPHMMAIFHSQLIKDLSTKDALRYKTLGNMKQEEYWFDYYQSQFKVQLKYFKNPNFEIAKLAYDFDSALLNLLSYSSMKTEKIVQKLELSEENMFSEDFEDKKIEKEDDDGISYDFSFHKLNSKQDSCYVNLPKFFQLEFDSNNLNPLRLFILKNDVLSQMHIEGTESTRKLLIKEIINSENYLSGIYKDFSMDPDYKLY